MHLKIGSGLLLLDHFFFYLGFFASIVILTFMAGKLFFELFINFRYKALMNT